MNPAHVRRIPCVGALVRDPDGRLLLVQRAHDPGSGQWSLPGGKVEDGETDAVALRREVREETGLEVTVGDAVGAVERQAPDGVLDIRDYRVVVTGGDLRAGDDAAAVRWVNRAMFTTLRDDNALVADLFEQLAAWGELPG